MDQAKQNNAETPSAKSLKEIMREVTERVRQRYESKEIIGLRRRQLLPEGNGGEYFVQEVIGLRP